jgi:hypothetical protein
VNRRWFGRFLDTLWELKVEVPRDLAELKVHLQHDVSPLKDHRDIFRDIDLVLVSSEEPSGMPPAFPIEKQQSRLARQVKMILDDMTEKGHVFLVVGAGIDPIYLGESLDQYFVGKDGTNLAKERVVPNKRYLAVCYAATSLLWRKQFFVGAYWLSQLATKIEKISMITTNWSHSLERHGTPRVLNTRALSFDPRANRLHVGLKVQKDIIDFIEGERRSNDFSPYWVFVSGSNLRRSDFGLFLGSLLNDAEGLVANSPDDRRSVCSLLQGQYHISGYPFLGVYESAPILFRGLSSNYE